MITSGRLELKNLNSLAIPTTNENLTKALGYAMNQRKNLETFLLVGRLVISNNLCESNIRPFTTARKAWLFADTPKGAGASVVVYSIIDCESKQLQCIHLP